MIHKLLSFNFRVVWLGYIQRQRRVYHFQSGCYNNR